MSAVLALALMAADAAILARDWQRAYDPGPAPLAVITLIAAHEDGTPLRGYIQCAGVWYKHEDDPARVIWGDELPFKTDSRGAAVFNPHTSMESITCWASDRGMWGSVTVWFSDDAPRQITRFTLNQKVNP